jgi:outer membrane immunogenic protein
MRLIKLAMLAAASSVVFATGGALAADLARPVYRAPPPVVAVYTWTGLYWGANVGYSWGTAKYDATLIFAGATSNSEDLDGAVVGVQSGYNYQVGAWVFGAETDIQWSGQKGGSTFPGVLPLTTITTDQKLKWFGTSRSRLGVLVTPNILLYGTAGVAYGQVESSATITITGVGSATGSFKDVKAGWTAGAGIEGAFGGGWSAKLEYLYIDLGKTEHTFATPFLGTVATETRRTTDNIVRAGLNYKWGG